MTVSENQFSRKEISQKMQSGFRWMLTTTILWQVISWVLTLFTARILRPSDYGLLALNEAIYPYLILLASFRIEVWAVQRKDFSQNDQKQVMSFLLILGFLTSLLAFFAAYGIAAFYESPEALLPFQIGSMMYFFRALQILPEVKLRRELRFREQAVMNLSIGVFRGVVQLILAYYGWSYWSLVIGNILSEVLRSLWLASITGLPRPIKIERSLAKEILTFGFHVSGATIFWILYSTSDNVVVGKFLGRETLGFYSMAFYLTDLPLSKINSVLAPLMLPYFSRMKEFKNGLRLSYLRSQRLLLFFLIPVIFGLAGTAPQLLPLLLGDRWNGIVPFFQILCIVGLLRAIPTYAGTVLTAVGRSKDLFTSSMLSGIVLPSFFILGAILGDRIAGFNGALAGIFLTWIFLYPLTGIFYPWYTIRSVISFQDNLALLIRPLTGGFIMLLVLLQFELSKMTIVSILLLKIPVGALCYLFYYIVLGKRDLLRVFSVAKQVFYSKS